MSVRAMNWAIQTMKDLPLSQSQRLVLIALAQHHHDKSGQCNPSIETIGKIAGLTRRPTQNAVNDLHEMGLIEKKHWTEHGKSQSNRYVLFGKFRGAASDTPKRVDRGAASSTRAASDTRAVQCTPTQPLGGASPAAPNREVHIPDRLQGGGAVVEFPARVMVSSGGAA